MSVAKTNSQSSALEIEAFNKKKGIKRDLVIGIVAFGAIGTLLTLSHVYHIPLTGQIAIGGGFLIAGVGIRSIVKNRQNKAFTPLDSCPTSANETVKNFWIKLNAFHVELYKKQSNPDVGAQIVQEFLKNKDELGGVFDDFLFKVMGQYPKQFNVILSLLSNDERIDVALFSAEKNPVGTYVNLGLFGCVSQFLR